MANSFGRELDRRERIFDFVRHPAGHFAPRGGALRLQHVGHVVEHDDIAGTPSGKSRPTHQQRALTARAKQYYFGLPFGTTCSEVALQRFDQW